MRQIFWVLLGAALMLSGQALADSFVFQDSHGRSGTIQSVPGPMPQDWMGPSRQMGQQLQGVLQNSQRNPC